MPANLGGHAHLAEPGCLCTKQALGARASKPLENRLGTHRRTSYLLTASGVGTRSPTWTTAVEWKGAVICTPSLSQVPIHSWVDWWGWWEAGEEDWTISICEWWGLNPWPMDHEPNAQTTTPPGPTNSLIATHMFYMCVNFFVHMVHLSNALASTAS